MILLCSAPVLLWSVGACLWHECKSMGCSLGECIKGSPQLRQPCAFVICALHSTMLPI